MQLLKISRVLMKGNELMSMMSSERQGAFGLLPMSIALMLLIVSTTVNFSIAAASPADYEQAGHVAPELIETISDWIAGRDQKAPSHD